MEGSQFDALSRRLGAVRSRRSALKAIAGAVVAGIAGTRGVTAQTCTEHYSPCTGDDQCCAGAICEYGMCMPGCRIDGGFVNAWMSPPGDSCNQCRPELSTTAWTPVNEGMSCWSGDPAAGATFCLSGECRPTGPAQCPPPSPCHTDDLINPATCTYALAPAGTVCGGRAMCHGGFYTPADTCDGNGFCIGGGSKTVACAPYACGTDACLTSCAADGDCVGGTVCCDGACVSLDSIEHCGACGAACPTESDNVCLGEAVCSNGTCGFVPLPAGTACGDDQACNGMEACDGAGVCVPGLPVVCTAPDACHTAGTCDPETGQCSPAIPTTDLQTDLNNCGTCGNVCTTAVSGATPVCAAGQCGVACPDGQVVCDDACIPLDTTENCGTCGTACSPQDACCDGVCTSLDTDTSCGACGVICQGGTTCVNGECADICLPPASTCSATEECCQEEDTECSLAWEEDRCCRPLGGNCTSDLDCCNAGNAGTVYCSPDGVCGGTGATCRIQNPAACAFQACYLNGGVYICS